MKSKKTIAIIISIALLLGIVMLFVINEVHHPTSESEIILLRNNSTPKDWLAASSLGITDKTLASIFCNVRRIDKLKRGRYVRKINESLWELISRMRSGEQDPLRIKIDQLDTIEEMCGILGENLYHDSTSFLNYFQSDTTLTDNKTTFECLPCLIAPNEYEFYWTISPQEFLKKMRSVRDAFWDDTNDQLAQSVQLNRNEVCILASIVKAETGNKNEAATISGLYLNRLKQNIPLQSDPTAIFRQRKDVKRVLTSDIETHHEFNTYKITGLPPGPICFVEDFYLKSVLRPQIHNYIYMCAEPGMTGKHKFTSSYSEHLINAKKYHLWLDRKGG